MLIINGRTGKLETRPSPQYDGSKIPGEFDQWINYTQDPNEFIKLSYGTLCDRSMTLYHTEPAARAAIEKPLCYTVGDGLFFRSQIDHNYLGMNAKKASDWSKRFTTLLHLEKIQANYYQKQSLLVRAGSITGDSWLYFIRDEATRKMGLPFDLVTATGETADWEYSKDKYTLGIKMDDYNRRTGFRQAKTGTDIKFKTQKGRRNAIQFMFKMLPGQARGYGMIYHSIAMLKRMGRIWDAVTSRMVLEGMLVATVDSSEFDAEAEILAMAEAAAAEANGGTAPSGVTEIAGTQAMSPGGIMQVRGKSPLKFTDMKSPSNNFDTANQYLLKLLAMARGYPPEFISGEYNTSYTAHKGALNDSMKMALVERGGYVSNVDTPVNQEYLEHFWRTGQIDLPPDYFNDYRVRRAFLAGVTLGPVPGHINPLQEVNADLKQVMGGLNTFDNVARKYGNEWEAMYPLWVEEQSKFLNGSADFRAEQMAAQEAIEAAKLASEEKAAKDEKETTTKEVEKK